MPPLYQNPFSEKKILGPGETDPKADVELARTLLGDEAAEECAEALAGSARVETLSEGFTDDEKAAMQKHAQDLEAWKVEQKRRIELTIGGKTKEVLLAEMKAKGIAVSEHANDLIHKITFPETKEHLTLVKLTVSDLGFTDSTTLKEIYAKAKELGLEVVPPETGIYLRLQYTTQPKGEELVMGMDPITDPDGGPDVFELAHIGAGLWLDYGRAALGRRWWRPGVQFVFRLPDQKK